MRDFMISRDCFSTEEMRCIWSETGTISAWLKVEQTLAECQAKAGIIPPEAAEAICAINVSDLDHEVLASEMLLVGRPIVGLVKELKRQVAEKAEHVHHASSTQDIMDTAIALQMKHGLIELTKGLDRLVGLLNRHIETHPDKLIMARTNGQYAVPISLAMKLGVWRSELLRRKESLDQAALRGLNVQVGGPVGDLRGYDEDHGERVKTAVADALGLGTITPNWQSARDGIADVVTAIGTLSASLCKIAHTLNLLSSSDIAEVSETYTKGRGASSSMPHKKNQRASEFAEAVARLARQRSEQIGELTLHEHERSGGVWIGEWVVVPEVFLLASGAVMWSETLLRSIEFKFEKVS